MKPYRGVRYGIGTRVNLLWVCACLLSATSAQGAEVSMSTIEVKGPGHFEEICAAARYTREGMVAVLRVQGLNQRRGQAPCPSGIGAPFAA